MALCEMCGKQADLVKASIEAVELSVCQNCARYGQVKQPPRRWISTKTQTTRQDANPDEPEVSIVENYAQILRNIRETRSMTNEEFARSLNERESIVSKWEQGSLKPSIATAYKLQRLLHIKLVKKEGTQTDKDKDQTPQKEQKQPQGKPSSELTIGDFIKIRNKK